MTIEQLEKANEINRKIEVLRGFRYDPEFVYMKLTIGEKSLDLSSFQDLKDLILGYLSDKTAELEKQLEEL